MSTLARRDYRGPFGEMIDFLETPWTFLRPVSSHPVRVEDFFRDGTYVIRAELPGIDPDKDLDVQVVGGVLTISAERRQEVTDSRRSEFHYGTFSRSVTSQPKARALPPLVETSEATDSTAFSSMSRSRTHAPLSAKHKATAWPMPLPAPVTTASLPSRRKECEFAFRGNLQY